MKLDEAKEVLAKAGFELEEGMLPAQQAQLAAFAKVMDIVDGLINYISENGDNDDGRLEYIINQLIKAQKLEKQAQMIK